MRVGGIPGTELTSMNAAEMVRLVQEASGEEDVEVVQLLPAKIRYQDQTLHPLRVVRKGRRYLVEVVEFPGEWWMGEFDGDTLVVWGSFDTLAEAAGGRTEESDDLRG